MDESWGPCESREEWLLMYEHGLSPERIADLCRTSVRNVRRVAASKDRRDRGFFDRRLVLHDQPAVPKRRPLLTWQQKYENLCWFVKTAGRLPRQDGSTWERQCHGFLYQQRHEHHSGRLTAQQLELLNLVPGWYVPPRAPEHWQQRFTDYLRFMEQNGRRPRVEAPKGSEERSLMIWMLSQRKRLRAGTMPEARVALLDHALPRWQRHAAVQEGLNPG
ncbi:Helicase associated domain protein [Arthrobacter agilis]|uniref:Helicase associated domain protein n=1 Tax=Arthrobacter agilis TaxID=37921 RepID=UPI0027897207|nr:hypothetical protein [Arthrobacter agilis]MDQ0735170.1 hypothetical protein [Arthrobacter agilis]